MIKNNQELSDLCEKLHDVPLALKWIAGAIANGASVSEALRSRGDLLRYCFETIYSVLSVAQRRILEAFQSVKRPLSGAELQYFSPNLEDFDQELNRLRMTSMLQSTTDKTTGRSLFNLADAASDFLKKYHSPRTDEYLIFIRLEKSLSVSEQLAAQVQSRDYHRYSVHVDPTNKDSVIASISLKQAVEAAKRRDFGAAREAVEHAKRLHSESIEAYRISAVLYAEQREFAKADDDFDIALSLAEDQPDPVLFDCIANFYLRQLRSKFVDALQYAERAVGIDPQADALNTLARARLFLGRYDDVLAACNRILEQREGTKPRAVRMAYAHAAESCRRAAEKFAAHLDKRALAYVGMAFDYLIEAVNGGYYDKQLASKACESLIEVSREGVNREEWIAEYHALLQRVSEVPGLFAGANRDQPVGLADQVVRACRHSSLQRLAARFLESIRGETSRLKVVDSGFAAGVINHYVRDKGYGFITLWSGEQIFFHQSVLEATIDRIRVLGLPVLVRAAVADKHSRRRALEVRAA
jgi:tetratricopeptide (TPR) repeat protein/cold shock CspA family protein